MRCLAICQDELLIKVLDEILLASFEIEFLVDSPTLARRLSDAGVHITAADLKRKDTYLKADISPSTCVIVQDTGKRGLKKVLDNIRDAGRHADLRAGRGHQRVGRTRGGDQVGVPRRLVPGDGGAVWRAAAHRVRPLAHARPRAAVPALLRRRGSRADPAAQRPRSGRDGQRAGAAQPAAPYQGDGHHRRLAERDAAGEPPDGEPARHPRRDHRRRGPRRRSTASPWSTSSRTTSPV